MPKKKDQAAEEILKGLMNAAASEKRQQLQEQYKAAAFERERNDQIKQFKKNIRGAKVYVWKE
jgi:hypothetical protein